MIARSDDVVDGLFEKIRLFPVPPDLMALLPEFAVMLSHFVVAIGSLVIQLRVRSEWRGIYPRVGTVEGSPHACPAIRFGNIAMAGGAGGRIHVRRAVGFGG